MVLKKCLHEHARQLKNKLSCFFRHLLVTFLSLFSIPVSCIKSLHPLVMPLFTRVKAKTGKPLAATPRSPYFLPSFALIVLFFIYVILLSTTTEHESFASVVHPEPTVDANVVKATLKIEEPTLITIKTEPRSASIDYDSASLKELFVFNSPIGLSRGIKRRGELSITFDGGWSDHAREILDILADKGIKTTFFLTGHFIRTNPELVKEIIASGHEVGNHTFSHPHLTAFDKTLTHATLENVTKEYLTEQLNSTAKLFKEVTGTDIAPYWRAPFGEINHEIAAWALEAGYVHVGWTRDYEKHITLDTLDWVSDTNSNIYYTASEIKQRVLAYDNEAYGLNGGIILMHLGTRRRKEKAVSILAELIDEVRSRGLSFVKVSSIAQNLIDASKQSAQRKIVLNEFGKANKIR